MPEINATTREIVPAGYKVATQPIAKGAPVLKVPALPDAQRSPRQGGFAQTETVLYDLTSDADQLHPITDQATEDRMVALIIDEMLAHDAPGELFKRFDLEIPDLRR